MLRIISCLAILLTLSACESDVDTQSPTRQLSQTEASEDLFPVWEDGRWGYIDGAGEVAIEPRFDRAWRFSDGIALVKDGENYGYIRPDGNYVLEPRFSDAWHFANGLAPVELDGQWGFVDTSGAVVADTQFSVTNAAIVESRYEEDSFHLTRSEGRYGFSTADGERVIDPRFEQAWRFSDGLARVKSDGKWGYINQEGEFEIEPQFDLAWDFRQGLAMVQAGDTVGYIDREGRYVWPGAR